MVEIQKIRLFLAMWISLVCALSIPTFITLQGKFFTATQLSLILMIPVVLKCFQTLATKMPTWYSLYLPLFFDMMWPFSLVLAYNNLRLYLIVEIAGGAVFGMLYYNRTLVITEMLKDKHEIPQFFNKQITWGSTGALIGYVLSYYITELCTPFMVIVISTLTAFVMIPALFRVNRLVLTNT